MYVNENEYIWEASFWQGEIPLLLVIDSHWSYLPAVGAVVANTPVFSHVSGGFIQTRGLPVLILAILQLHFLRLHCARNFARSHCAGHFASTILPSQFVSHSQCLLQSPAIDT